MLDNIALQNKSITIYGKKKNHLLGSLKNTAKANNIPFIKKKDII